LFRAFGIDVRVHWSFVLILVYGAFIFGGGTSNPITGALYGVLVTILLFVCVTLHEFGHALVAQYFQVKVSNITLLPIGGVANLERMPDKPMQELLITLAGPLVNFALAVVLLPITLLLMAASPAGVPASPGELLRAIQQPGAVGLVGYLLFTNILLGLFNLLPAFPMDGGRILRALLAMTLPYVRATQLAVLVGRVIAVLMAFWGLASGNIWLLLIAFFVYVGGSGEREAVESKAVLRHYIVEQALTPSAVNLYSSERLNRAVDLIMNSYQTDYAVLDLGSKFIGVLTRPRLIAALREYGPDARVIDVMEPAETIPVVPSTMNLSEVWEAMVGRGTRVVAVKDHGVFRGLVTLEDLSEVFQVMSAKMVRSGPPSLPGEETPAATPPPPNERSAADA
jgi:Zn-dependent protease